MNLNFGPEEEALLARLDSLLARPTQAVPGNAPDTAQYDATSMRALEDGGFLALAKNGAQGRLAAMLVIQTTSKLNVQAPVGVHAMVVPALFDVAPAGLVAIKRAGRDLPVRFVDSAGTLIIVGEGTAHAYPVISDQVAAVDSNYGFPLGRYSPKPGIMSFGNWPAALVRRRWQLAIAGEIVGAMSGALDHLVAYLSRRKQFGREIGSFQAIQHRLAELAVSVESARYLTLQAAWSDSAEQAAETALYSATAAHTLCLEAHQLCGALGFALEFGLNAWTLRLQALSVEAGGPPWHAAVVTSLRLGYAGDKPEASVAIGLASVDM